MCSFLCGTGSPCSTWTASSTATRAATLVSARPGSSRRGVWGVRSPHSPWSVAVASPFPRAIATLDLALEGRAIPRIVDDDLGDIRLGELEGGTVAEYRAATAHGDRNVRFPGGESLNEAARRYARAFEQLLARSERATLVVCHEMVVRYSVNAAAGSEDLDRPLHDVVNAAPYLFDEAGLEAAMTRMLALAAERHDGGSGAPPGSNGERPAWPGARVACSGRATCSRSAGPALPPC